VKISRNSECLRIILAMTLIFWAGSAMAQEQRCNQLGSVCQCSERLDTNTFSWDNTPNSSEDVNPTDTNSKECRGGKSITVGEQNGNSSQITYLVPTAETGMPAGNTVNYVWRWNRGQGYILGATTNTIQSSTKRMCYRQYIRMSPTYDGGDIRTDPSSPNCDGGKFAQFWWTLDHGGYQVQMGSGGCAGRNCEFFLGVPDWNAQPAHNMDFTGSLKYSDCYGQWCRLEMCVSGDFNGNTGSFFLEGYAVRLSDGKQKTWPRYNMGPGDPANGHPGLTLANGWIVNGFRGDGNDPLTCTNGIPQDATNRGAWRDISYLMHAEWPVDVPGTFIGPAVEVEGGSGAPPPPPSAGEELGKPGTPSYQAP
jgi:hypothetical protein